MDPFLIERDAEIRSNRLRIFARNVDLLRGGSSPFLKLAIVGRDNSSATQGSSTFSVAGKKRLPTMQCALAAPRLPNRIGDASISPMSIVFITIPLEKIP